MLTVDYLVKTLGGVQKAADFFGVSRTAIYKWRERGIPEEIHFICHCSELFDYTYDPNFFGRDGKALQLVLTKQTTNEVTTNDQTIHSAAA
ncbi:hypothetical protein B6G00_04265 [Salinivibrio sp. YCSC6]|nr:hypothetical protein B6G00_04265 [Salinivibrio sp. YCSC6]